jgi:UDP-N-acetylmuramyl pentapeptide phosphotransferase/UDP-N-acetylglucosamine-1-phosphate transferase
MPDAAETVRFWLIAGPLIAGVAGFASAGLIVALGPLLQRYALALPNARSSHRIPTPQGGGIAVAAATLVATALAAVVVGSEPGVRLPLVLGAFVFIAVVGAVDDMRGLPVAPRFLLQALAVGAVIAALPPEWRVLAPLPWWAERALLLVAGLWFVNLVNFMDGIDWMTVAETIPLTLGLVLVGIAGALPPAAIVVALALGGATAGFAPFNRPVARLFLGDVGSLPIGLMLCWLLLLLAARGHVAAALLLPLYYLADATITLARRIVQGEAVWQAHRSHFYQRATERYSVMQVVTRVFVANLGLAALAFVAVIADHAAIDAAALACGAAFVTWLLVDFARSGR